MNVKIKGEELNTGVGEKDYYYLMEDEEHECRSTLGFIEWDFL